MNTDALAVAFDAAVDYDDYIRSSPDKTDAFKSIEEQISLTTHHIEMLGSWTRDMRVLVISGTWCGDCVRQVPVLAAIAARHAVSAAQVALRFVTQFGGAGAGQGQGHPLAV